MGIQPLAAGYQPDTGFASYGAAGALPGREQSAGLFH